MFEFCFVASGLPKKTSVLVTGPLQENTFRTDLQSPIIYDVSFSALVGRRMLGNSIDNSGHSVDHAILGGDSSLDLEKVVFQAFYFLTSFALAGFHVDLRAFHGISVFRSH